MKQFRLGELARVENGNAFKSSEYTENGARIIRITNVQNGRIVDNHPRYISKDRLDEFRRYTINENDLLMSLTGDVGRVGLFPRTMLPALLNQRVARIIPDFDIIDKKWLFYRLNNHRFELEARSSATGAAQKNMSTEWLKKYKIIAPSIEHQRVIVQKLDMSFEKIDQAIELTEQNMNNSQILFNKLINDQIINNLEFPNITLGSVCQFVRGPFGGSLKKDIFVPSGYAIYEQRHAIYGDFSNLRYFIDENKFKEMNRFEVHPHDLIMSCSGTIGKIAIAPEGLKPGIINQALLKFSPDKEKLIPEYLKHWIESSVFQDMLNANTGGAAIKNVASVKILKELPISLPPVAVQEITIDRINTLKESQQKLIASMKNKLLLLRALKQSMLNQAFSESDVK